MKAAAKHKFPNGTYEFEIAHKHSEARYTIIAPTAGKAWHAFTKLGFRQFTNPNRDDWEVIRQK